MSFTNITDLPAELLDKIFYYLDWDKTVSRAPVRPDLFEISLTCQALRASVIPLLFRNVKLSLRWLDGQLIEPSLYRLRRHHPELAQHIRCVHIDTKHGQRIGQGRPNVPPFTVPERTEDWLNPEWVVWQGRQHYVELNDAHRRRVESIVQAMELEHASPPSDFKPTAEAVMCRLVSGHGRITRSSTALPRHDGLHGQDPEVIRQAETQRNAKNRADALAVVMLCMPATLTSIVFEATRLGLSEAAQGTFVLHTVVAAFKVFAPRLESFTTIENMASQLSSRSRLARTNNNPDAAGVDILPASVLEDMTNLQRLVLVQDEGLLKRAGSGLRTFVSSRYHALSATVTRLELCNFCAARDDHDSILEFVTAFTKLRYLAFRDFRCSGPSPTPLAQLWLEFAVNVRRSLPNPHIVLTGIHAPDKLPESALTWLMTEAVPIGANIGLDRMQRLSDDFASFLPLWEAESSDRGHQAAEERKDGALVEAAMCSRWRNFSNVRRDGGEWTTL